MSYTLNSDTGRSRMVQEKAPFIQSKKTWRTWCRGAQNEPSIAPTKGSPVCLRLIQVWVVGSGLQCLGEQIGQEIDMCGGVVASNEEGVCKKYVA